MSEKMPIHTIESQHTPLRVFFFSWLTLAVTLTILSGFMFFARLDGYPMQNWDEGVHSQVTKEMVQTEDYWTLQYQGELYFRKPPLKIWITAPMVSAFGDHNWVYRFWSALAGVGSVLLFARLVWERERKRTVAWLSGLIFVSGQFVFYHAFRTAEMDALLIFFTILGMYAYYKAEKQPRWYAVVGASFGLAVMSKSLAGFVGPMIVVLDMLVQGRWRLLRSKHFLFGVLMFVVVTVPWHASQMMLWGRAFWDQYIGFHVVDRTFTQLYADLPSLWYAKILYGRIFPHSIFLVGGILFAMRDILRDRKKDVILIMLWLLVPFILYTWIKTKFEWYMLPLYPAAAWIIARYMDGLMRNFKDWLFQVTGFLSAVMLFALLPTAVIPGAKTYWLTIQAYVPGAVEKFFQNPYIFSGVFVSLAVGAIVFLAKKNPRYAMICIALFFSHTLLFSFGRNIGTIMTQPSESPFERIRDQLLPIAPHSIICYETDLYMKPAGYFELARVTPSIVQPMSEEELQKAIVPGAVVITSETDPSFTGLEPIFSVDTYHVYVYAE